MESEGVMARSSFLIFGDIVAAAASDVAGTELFVPVGHTDMVGNRGRTSVRTSLTPTYSSTGRGASSRGSTVTTVDVSAGVDLLAAGSVDPHFRMDPVRVGEATENVRRAFAAADPRYAEAYATNADASRRELDGLTEPTVRSRTTHRGVSSPEDGSTVRAPARVCLDPLPAVAAVRPRATSDDACARRCVTVAAFDLVPFTVVAVTVAIGLRPRGGVEAHERVDEEAERAKQERRDSPDATAPSTSGGVDRDGERD